MKNYNLEEISKIKVKKSYKCPHCNGKVIKSDNPEYQYQCLKCDEDFYLFEVLIIK